MLAALYATYEVVRGAGDTNLTVARDHTADIVSLERALHVFSERTVQEWSHGVPYLPALLGLAYMSLHFGATAFAVRWVYRERRDAFPLVRTTLIASTAHRARGLRALPGRAAAPRRARILRHRHEAHRPQPELGPARELLQPGRRGSVAARRLRADRGRDRVRARAPPVGARPRRVYPAFMLFDVVATGNHFWFDAAAGAAVVVAGWWIARALVSSSDAAAPVAHRGAASSTRRLSDSRQLVRGRA